MASQLMNNHICNPNKWVVALRSVYETVNNSNVAVTTMTTLTFLGLPYLSGFMPLPIFWQFLPLSTTVMFLTSLLESKLMGLLNLKTVLPEIFKPDNASMLYRLKGLYWITKSFVVVLMTGKSVELNLDNCQSLTII